MRFGACGAMAMNGSAWSPAIGDASTAAPPRVCAVDDVNAVLAVATTARTIRRAERIDMSARSRQTIHAGRSFELGGGHESSANISSMATRGVCAFFAMLAIVAGPLGARNASAQSCPAQVDDSAFASAAKLRAMNKVEADAGPRPTASAAHEHFIDWLAKQASRIKGLKVRSEWETIDQQLETGARVAIHRRNGSLQSVRVAGAVPYSGAKAATGRLVYIPPTVSIASQDVKGKIIVRDQVEGTLPQAVFFAVADYVYDPDATLSYLGN